MAINFIPNDPLASGFVPMRTVSPRSERSAAQAGFTLDGSLPEGTFAPGTPSFLFWQCREAAHLAIEVWERLNGPLVEWSPQAQDRKRLLLLHDAGDGLNAFYDRRSLLFFHHETDGHTTFGGASTDLVCHEAGHAFLDAIRPDLHAPPFVEQAAFHESFADCIAMLVALDDAETRDELLRRTPDLGKPSFVTTIAEDPADGVKRAEGEDDSGSAPRSALNEFVFQLPNTLPTDGPPHQLTSDPHSFSRVFTGCFYDIVRNIFTASVTRDSEALLAASRRAGKLLIAAARQAQVTARFFQSVGRAMVLSDDAHNGGANRSRIGEAFARHGVHLGSSAALMPRFTLAGDAPDLTRSGPEMLARATMRDLRRRLGASLGARVGVKKIVLGTTRLVEAVHQRRVDLTGLAKEMKGVVAVAPEAMTLGASGLSAAAFSASPDEDVTIQEVRTFVETLLTRDLIGPATSRLATHAIRTVGGQKVLTRVRFACAR